MSKSSATPPEPPFWETKSLPEMSPSEWESLCDGCAQCCLVKLEDEDTGERFLTRIACRLLDCGSCRCTDYDNRHESVPDCIALTPDTVPTLDWLPETCAYRLVHRGEPLAWWHPLVSGDPQTVHEAGISIRPHAISERAVKPQNMERFIISE